MCAINLNCCDSSHFVGDDSMREVGSFSAKQVSEERFLRKTRDSSQKRKVPQKEGRQMTELWLVLVSCCIFIFTLTAIGQVQNGQFVGTVTDQTGAAIAGAKVTVTNMATNVAVRTTTNQSGLYVIKELPIGTYKVTAEASGFKTREDTNLALNAGV